MNLLKRISLLTMAACLLLGLFAACSQTATTIPAGTLRAPAVSINTPPEQMSPTEPKLETQAPALTPVVTEAVPLPENRTQYKLDLILNYYSRFGTVNQEIVYTNRSSQPMAEILLAIPPKYFSGSFELRSLSSGPNDTTLPTRDEDTNLYVQLPQPLAPGESNTLKLAYKLTFPLHDSETAGPEATYGVTGRQTNLFNWYPYIPPYTPESGWQVHPRQFTGGMQVGEFVVNELADFDVSLRLTDRAELIEIAASAPGTETDGLWRYRLEAARGFSFSISDSFFEHEIVQDGVRIHSYAFLEHEDAGVAVTEIAAQAIKLFGELYFPYPREIFSIVSADFLHNMEMDGMVMISYGVFDFYDGTPKTNLTILTPHEISHQWFYSMVGNDQATEPWVDEALATYNEVIFYDRYQPDLVQWWWNNRVIGFSPGGYVNSDIYVPGGYPIYRDAVYLRGAMFMQELRDTVGDQAFFAALKDYAQTNRYQIASGQSFFDAIARHSSADISRVLAKYFAP